MSVATVVMPTLVMKEKLHRLKAEQQLVKGWLTSNKCIRESLFFKHQNSDKEQVRLFPSDNSNNHTSSNLSIFFIRGFVRAALLV